MKSDDDAEAAPLFVVPAPPRVSPPAPRAFATVDPAMSAAAAAAAALAPRAPRLRADRAAAPRGFLAGSPRLLVLRRRPGVVPPGWRAPSRAVLVAPPRAALDLGAPHSRGDPSPPDSSSSSDASAPLDLDLGAVLARVRVALGVDDPSSDPSAGMIWGEGRNLGMPARWCLRHLGASFAEESTGPELSYVSGHLGGSGEVWETDFTGYTQALCLDDREAALLSGWVRTNFWARPEAADVLDRALVSQVTADEDSEDSAIKNAYVVSLRCSDGGLVTARVTVCADTFLPAGMTCRVCGDVERWTFERWTAAEWGTRYPARVVLANSGGGDQTFDMHPRGFRRNPGVPVEWFDRPTSGGGSDSIGSIGGFLPGSVAFLPGVPPEVSVVSGHRSSHVLVRPLIDGKDVGPFILDTGASGLVISRAAANRLKLRAFGEVHVSGVAGKVPCRFRRAAAVTLGPIRIDRPVFMEMDVGGIVGGASEPVAGIVGFDAFKCAVCEVGPGGAPVRLHDPRAFRYPPTWTWHELVMVSNVPHVRAAFEVPSRSAEAPEDRSEATEESSDASSESSESPGGTSPVRRSEIFMIDSGAGGADCIFHARAVDALGLEAMLPPVTGAGARRGSSRVRGVGGSAGESSGSTRAYRGEMARLDLEPMAAREVEAAEGEVEAAPRRVVGGRGGSFSNLSVLLAADAGFDLSEHSVGLICANALGARRVVYDLPNRRLALLVDGEDDPPPRDASIFEATTRSSAFGAADDESDGSLPRKEPPGFVAGIVESVKGLAGERRGSALGREE